MVAVVVLAALGAGAVVYVERATRPTVALADAADAPVTTTRPTTSTTRPPGGGEDEPGGGEGVYGQTEIGWSAAGVDYRAVLDTSGPRGTAVVTFEHPTTAESVSIREKLTFGATIQGKAYVGSDPVDADTGQAEPAYRPDTFRVVQNLNGKWVVDAVCDVSGCFPVSR